MTSREARCRAPWRCRWPRSPPSCCCRGGARPAGLAAGVVTGRWPSPSRPSPSPGRPVRPRALARPRRGRRPAGRRHRRRRARERARLSPYLAHRGAARSARRADRGRTGRLFAFWAILLAVPLAGNLGAAWLLIEATTAASALLVGFSGRARALEAGWKYLILTSLGLGVALLGIVLLAARAPGRPRRALVAVPAARSSRPRAALVAYLLLLAGPRREDRAGRRCTTGCPTPTPRRRRRSRRCSRPRCCRRSCSSRGARSRRSRPSIGERRAQRRPDRRSGSSRSRSRCRSSGARWPGSGCSPTRASSTWA